MYNVFYSFSLLLYLSYSYYIVPRLRFRPPVSAISISPCPFHLGPHGKGEKEIPESQAETRDSTLRFSTASTGHSNHPTTRPPTPLLLRLSTAKESVHIFIYLLSLLPSPFISSFSSAASSASPADLLPPPLSHPHDPPFLRSSPPSTVHRPLHSRQLSQSSTRRLRPPLQAQPPPCGRPRPCPWASEPPCRAMPSTNTTTTTTISIPIHPRSRLPRLCTPLPPLPLPPASAMVAFAVPAARACPR